MCVFNLHPKEKNTALEEDINIYYFIKTENLQNIMLEISFFFHFINIRRIIHNTYIMGNYSFLKVKNLK